jgi:hypothetical protein
VITHPGFVNVALVGLVLAGPLSLFPLWRSATLSPDSMKRRIFWTGTAIASVSMFPAVWPNWKLGVATSILVALAMTSIAARFTRHIKIRGKVYGVQHNDGPDRRPSRAPKD